MRLVALPILVVLLMAGAANAAELRSIDVEHHKGRYSVSSEVWFEAPVAQVFEVFRRWDLSTQFSSAIVESRDIAADEHGRPGYYVRNQGCLLFFCKSFVRQGPRRTEAQRGAAGCREPGDQRLQAEQGNLDIHRPGWWHGRYLPVADGARLLGAARHWALPDQTEVQE